MPPDAAPCARRLLFSIDDTSYVSPNHEPRPVGVEVSAIVLHHGAGTRRSDLAWLCNPISGVSAQLYVCRDGTIYQLVPDDRRAWHAGVSALDGVPDVNDYSIGIEAEHTTDPTAIAAGAPAHTDWPPIQQAAIAWLIRTKLAAHPRITPARIVSHRSVALPAGRKSDPVHAPFAPETAFRAWVAGVCAAIGPIPLPAPAPDAYTANSPLMGAPRATEAQAAAYILARPTGGYTAHDITHEILPAYWQQATALGLDPVLAVAQMIHETGTLTSWWAQRPRRNAAGLGITGETCPVADGDPGPGWALDAAAGLFRRGLSFAAWAGEHGSVAAHVGRLVAYATRPEARSSAQQRAVNAATALRGLPASYHGAAPTLAGLDGRWAVPGVGYGGRVAAVAEAIRRQA